MGGDAPPNPYTSLWRTKGQIYVTFTLHLPLYFNTHNSPEGIGVTWGGGGKGNKYASSILYNDQKMHNYFTNYHTSPKCFDTIVSSSGSS